MSDQAHTCVIHAHSVRVMLRYLRRTVMYVFGVNIHFIAASRRIGSDRVMVSIFEGSSQSMRAAFSCGQNKYRMGIPSIIPD